MQTIAVSFEKIRFFLTLNSLYGRKKKLNSKKLLNHGAIWDTWFRLLVCFMSFKKVIFRFKVYQNFETALR